MSIALRRTASSVAFAVAVVAAAVVVLGKPDPGTAASFFSSFAPQEGAAIAVASLLVWMSIAGLALVVLLGAWRSFRSMQRAPLGLFAVSLALSGILLLAVAVAHRLTLNVPHLCCGEGPSALREAVQLVH